MQAVENANIQATTTTNTSSSGGSAFGTGTSLAVDGTLAFNEVRSTSSASITNSEITTTAGDLIVDAQNTSGIDATVLKSVATGDTGVGCILAFNSLGWEHVSELFDDVNTSW